MTCCGLVWYADITFDQSPIDEGVNEVIFFRTAKKHSFLQNIAGLDMEGCLWEYNHCVAVFAACNLSQVKLFGGMPVISQPLRSVLFC